METTNPTPTAKVVEAVLAYYHLADSFAATLPDALAWYETVPPDIQREIGLVAPYKWLTFPNFKRYLLEKNGISMHTYMAAHLAARDLNHWLLHGDGGIGDGGFYSDAEGFHPEKPFQPYGWEGFEFWVRTSLPGRGFLRTASGGRALRGPLPGK